MFFLYEEQSRRSVNASVIMFMVAPQSRALMQKLPSFINIMTWDKSATVWHAACNDMKGISPIPQPPADSGASLVLQEVVWLRFFSCMQINTLWIQRESNICGITCCLWLKTMPWLFVLTYKPINVLSILSLPLRTGSLHLLVTLTDSNLHPGYKDLMSWRYVLALY